MPTLKKKSGRGGPRPNSGGKREGAGRKPAREVPTVTLSAQVLPQTKERLQKEAEQAGKSLAAYVGEALDRFIKMQDEQAPERVE